MIYKTLHYTESELRYSGRYHFPVPLVTPVSLVTYPMINHE